MLYYHEAAQEVPVVRTYDVVIVGGGPAGTAAAIAAARAGAETLLVERFGYLGGTATASLMACINGFLARLPRTIRRWCAALRRRSSSRLKAMDGLDTSPYAQRNLPTEPGQLSYSYAIDTEAFKVVLLELCQEAGVHLLLHTWFARPMMEERRVTGILAESKSGRIALQAKVIVDASGDGDVAARAGAPYWQAHSDDPRLNDTLTCIASCWQANVPPRQWPVTMGHTYVPGDPVCQPSTRPMLSS